MRKANQPVPSLKNLEQETRKKMTRTKGHAVGSAHVGEEVAGAGKRAIRVVGAEDDLLLALVASTLFSLAHLPQLPLVALTLVAGFFFTLIPQSRAASSLDPIAKTWRPNTVYFRRIKTATSNTNATHTPGAIEYHLP